MKENITFEEFLEINKNNEIIMVTHNNMCHSDDCLCASLLSILFEREGIKYKLKRVTPEKMEDSSDNTLIFDVGLGRFDHHGPAGKFDGERKFAAIGLIWRWVKDYIEIEFPRLNWEKIDTDLIQFVDKADNFGPQHSEFNLVFNSIRDTYLGNEELTEEWFNHVFKNMKNLCKSIWQSIFYLGEFDISLLKGFERPEELYKINQRKKELFDELPTIEKDGRVIKVNLSLKQTIKTETTVVDAGIYLRDSEKGIWSVLAYTFDLKGEVGSNGVNFIRPDKRFASVTGYQNAVDLVLS